MGERISESDRGPRTADGSSTGFPASQGGANRQRMGNESTNGDRGRQTAEWTVDGGGGGFPAFPEDRQNFVTLRLGGLFFFHHKGTKTQ